MLGTTAAISRLREDAKPPAMRLGTYAVRSIASCTRVRTAWDTCAGELSARDTVMGDTPARWATSWRVIAPLPRRARFEFGLSAIAYFQSPMIALSFAHRQLLRSGLRQAPGVSMPPIPS